MGIKSSNNRPVVVVGGGFGGLTVALALSRCRPRPPIILIEPRQRFVFLPLLYELLSGELKQWEVAPKFSSLLVDQGIALLEDKVEAIDSVSKTVETSSGVRVSYHQLVLATGAQSSDFGVNGVRENAFMFYGLDDIQPLRLRIRELKQQADSSQAVVVVGAGPTGVELAGKLVDLLNGAAEVHLVELGDRLLPHAKAFNQEQAERAINQRGINVHLRTRVISVTSSLVELKSEQPEQSSISSLMHRGVIWTAGNSPVIPFFKDEVALKGSRLPINSYFQVLGFEDIFALGDVSYNEEQCCPSTAQVALQQGEALAQILMAMRLGHEPEAFVYKDFGEMLSLGMGEATITGMGMTIAGPLAYQLRRMTYLTRLPRISLGLRSAGAWLLGN